MAPVQKFFLCATLNPKNGDMRKKLRNKYFCFFCFDLGFHTRNPVIKYRPDASCMSYMEARVEMP